MNKLDMAEFLDLANKALDLEHYKLNLLVKALISDAGLNYNKDGLCVDYNSQKALTILEFIAPDEFNERLKELQNDGSSE